MKQLHVSLLSHCAIGGVPLLLRNRIIKTIPGTLILDRGYFVDILKTPSS